MPFLRTDHQFTKPVELSEPIKRANARFSLFTYIRQIIATAAFFIIGALVSPICWIIWKFFGAHISPRFGQQLLSRVFQFYIGVLRFLGALRLEAIGLEKLWDLRGTVIVSNHPALLDAAFLSALLPPAACVMRANLLRNPALQGSALLAGYVTNDSGPTLVRQGISKIHRGENLLIFPEGTRTVAQSVNRFKPGFAMVAVRTGAPVQTILIEHHDTHLSKGVSLFAPANLPMHFTIHCGELFMPQPSESARELSQRIERWFCSRIENSGNGIILKINPQL